MPQFQAKTAFQATRLFAYDSHLGTLQDVLDELEPFAFVKIPAGEYRADLRFRKPIYLQGDGPVKIVSTSIIFEGEFIVIDGAAIMGSVTVAAGYTSLLKCQGPSLSISGSATADIFQCDLVSLSLSDQAIVRCSKSSIHDSKASGVSVEGDAALTLSGCNITGNAAAGVTASGRANVRITRTEISHNGTSGIDLASAGHLRVEASTISDHPRGSGVLLHRDAAAVLHQNEVRGSGVGCIRAGSGGVAQSSNNVFRDSSDNPHLIAHDGGVIHSGEDSFQGSGAAAAAAFSGGQVQVRSATVEGLNGGFVVYDGGKLVLDDVKLTGLTAYGIQARAQSVLEAAKVLVTQVPGPGLVVRDQVHGFVRGSVFSGSSTVGAEFASVASFEVSTCEFVQNAVAGAILRDGSGVRFTECKFCGNGKVGVDASGDGCAPVFASCHFQKNELVGVVAADGAAPRLSRAVLGDGGKVGAVIVNAHLIVEGSDAAKCGEAAFVVGERGQLTVAESRVRDSANFGCQAQAKGATARFIGCTFTAQPVAVVAIEDAVVQCERCKIEGCSKVCGEARGGAFVHLDGCGVGPGPSEIGLQVHRGATLQINGCKVHGHAKFGVMIGDGICRAANTVITECGAGGVYTQDGAIGEFERCKIEKNGEIGVQAQGGTLRMNDCGVAGHTYGVIVLPRAEFSEVANKYEGNTKKDVYQP
jgi:hypothetical protein